MAKPADFSDGDAVGRRHLDPVDLARAQRGQSRVRLGDRHQYDVVDLRFFAAGPNSRHSAPDPPPAAARLSVMRNGPVPAAGKVATLAHSFPAFSNEVGEVNRR